MMQYQRRLIFAGLAIFLVTLLTNIPSDRALQLFRDKLPAGISWHQVSGSAFHPVFYNLLVRTPAGREVLIESADLNVAILPLLIGRLKMQFILRLNDGEFSGTAILQQQSWQLPEIEGNVSLLMLAEILPELKLTGPRGRVIFSGNALAGEYRNLSVTGELKATVEKLQLDMLNTQRPLGDYSIQLQSGDNKILQGRIETVSTDAQLSVQGDLSLAPESKSIQFEGQAWASSDAPASVQSLLTLLGPVEQGRARIRWQTRL